MDSLSDQSAPALSSRIRGSRNKGYLSPDVPYLLSQLCRIVADRVIDGLAVNQTSINRNKKKTILDLYDGLFDRGGLPRGNSA
jgi:hypothetical protein